MKELENLLPDRESLEQQVLRIEQDRQVHQALQKLHGEYREILHLLYFEDMRCADAALVLRKSIKQVENPAYRTKKRYDPLFRQEQILYAVFTGTLR